MANPRLCRFRRYEPAAKADTALLQRVEDTLKKAGLANNGLFLDTAGIKVRFTDTDTQIKARDMLQAMLGNGYMVALNLLPNSPQWLTSLGALPMYLGLDLRGGVHFLLQVDMKGALSKALDRFGADLRGSLREKKIPYAGLDKQGSQITVKFRNAESRAKAEAEINKTYTDLSLREDNVGADFHLIATLRPEAQKRIQDSAVQQNITTLRNRVNELGVAEPIIQQAGRRPRRGATAGRAGYRQSQGYPGPHRYAGGPHGGRGAMTCKQPCSGRAPFGSELLHRARRRPDTG